MNRSPERRACAVSLAISAAFFSGCNSVDKTSTEPTGSSGAVTAAPSLEDLLQDTAALRARAASWCPQSAEQLSQISAREHILNAVAVSHFRPNKSESDLESLRQGLVMAGMTPVDRYERSLIDLYSVLPEVPFGFGMVFGPDPVRLITIKNSLQESSRDSVLASDRFYPLETRVLGDRLDKMLRGVKSERELQEAEAIFSNFKASPLFEAIFTREAAPTEVERRARVALAQIVTEMTKELRELGGVGGRSSVSAEQLFPAMRNYLCQSFGVTDAVQPSIVAGLATKLFDCDVYTLVACEFGKQVGLPIEAIYLFDPSKSQPVGHCLPTALLRSGNQTRYVAYEMREPIERLPDGTERRLYRGFEEMKTRVNTLAGEELLGGSTIACLLTDRGKVMLVNPYGTREMISLSSSDMRILFGSVANAQERAELGK